MMHIIAFHLFNDFSGSPRVLRPVLESLASEGADIDLYTSDGGVLDALTALPGVHMHTVRYAYASNPVITIGRLLRSQAVAFWRLLSLRRRSDDLVYVNTILPFGAALGARLTGRKLIYHYHENAFAKGRMYRALAYLMQRLADRIICVSDYQASKLRRKRGVTIVPNAVPEALACRLHPDREEAFRRKRVLMLSSLKAYKGTREFIALASMLPMYEFDLVINDSDDNINRWFCDQGMERDALSNLSVYPAAADPSVFYNRASLVVSLTNPRLAVETFGLTAAEAMTAGLPVIVPVEGGIADLVADGVNGYRIDLSDLGRISETIDNIFSDHDLYERLSAGALAKSREFTEACFAERIHSIVSHI